ncbi:hypothetical protein EJB05_19325 [Eragrostis curvula]|uniref:Uncharacterized protein n=1 Tax=Eragrostis curvula TaxID=38414 RepID=A0A5J9UX00_9POAL|nr:hypothetical protein EJB05_19325 [Eragrostis curvula]
MGDQPALQEQGLSGDTPVSEILDSQRSAAQDGRDPPALSPKERKVRWNHSQMGRWVEAVEWSSNIKFLPPGCMLEFPVLFERAWGYDRLFTFDVDCTPETHAYIQEFYRRNCSATPSVTSALSLCMKMEYNLKSEWLRLGVDVNPDEVALSQDIFEHSLILLTKGTTLSATTSYAAACIAKEAELVLEWLRRCPNIDELKLSTRIRQHALNLMIGEAAGGPVIDMMIHSALVGITKEAEFLCKLMNERYDNPFSPNEIAQCREIREFALDVMMHKLDEYAAAARSAAENGKEPYAVWKRSLIATIERGDPTWGADKNYDAWNDDCEMKLIDRWRIKGSHKRKSDKWV